MKTSHALALLMVLLVTGTGPAAANNAQHTSAPVGWHAQSGRSGPVEGASARLTTNRSGAAVRVHTRELNAGHAYTLWWVVINNPDACQSSPCTPNPDILVNFEQTETQILFATGHVVGGAGRSTFAAHLPVGDIDNGWFPDQGFTNPLGAEIHVVVNDHGPALAEHMPGMIRTYRGGCSDDSPFPALFPQTALDDGQPGPNTCLLYQSAVFQQ